jgi:hypothetical protein
MTDRNRPASSPPVRWPRTAANVLVAACIFIAGRLSAAALTSPATSQSAHASGSESTTRPSGTRRPIRNPPRWSTPAFPAPDASDPASQHGDETAAHETAQFFFRRIFRRQAVIPTGVDPEMRANANREYLIGMGDALRMLDPSALRAVSDELNSQLCSRDANDDQTLVLAILAFEMPDLTTRQGFQCFFSRAKGKEDTVLWYMLDAFNNSTDERPEFITSLEKTAKDPRTLERLKPREERERAHAFPPRVN